MATTPLKRLKSVSKYLKKDEKTHTVTFTGKKLVARVPHRFSMYGFFSTEGNRVQTVGCADLVFDDKERAGLHLIAVIDTRPSSVSYETIEGTEYAVLTYYTGDLFLANTFIVKQKALIYALWTEYISMGHIPYWYEYEDILRFLDDADRLCDAALPTHHAILSSVYTHLSRTKSDLFKYYRHTERVGDFAFVPLNSVSFGLDSTSARLQGPYFTQGLMSSLVNPNPDNKIFEDIVRGLPMTDTNAVT
jgi:hypothetical protein